MFVDDESVLSRVVPGPDRVVSYGASPDQIADVRFGSEGAGHRPLVVVIHGGFWRPAYDRVHTGPMAIAIAAAGWTVASLEYRRHPGDPDAMLADIAASVAKLPALISRHNGSVLLVGHSAGGHLALWAAARLDDAGLRGSVALAPVADLQRADALHLSNDAVRAFLGADPVMRVDVDPARMSAPRVPVTIIQGLQDDTVPVSVTEAYAERHPKVRVVRLEQCGHYALIDPLSVHWGRVVEEIRRIG
ncbi:acetyl esterase/lipase [Povalibacter uvarum]|uniref:Acetyl esterase/lipase n=1 Tax=Povalibacter uvarum TaxID=732238 RepID=A0A841HSG6_9GAMM|nr:alpha/beta hydrolase [Povalibacter uvarum]MBB6095150.1 acetyl esterase/lipase [Povalibacter uvarum]